MSDAPPTLWQKIHRFLFDFSASVNNRREVEDILIGALAESKTDADFLPTLRRVIDNYEGQPEQGHYRYNHFRRFMQTNRRGSDFQTGIRIRAEHLLEDLPRIYGDKTKPCVATSASAPHTSRGAHKSSEPTTKEKTNDV